MIDRLLQSSFTRRFLTCRYFTSHFFTCLIFLAPALVLTTKIGIGLIEAVILASAVIFVKKLWLQRVELFHPVRWIIIAFAANLAVAAISVLWFGGDAADIDNPVRQLVILSAVGLMVLGRPSPDWFWYGLFVGAVGVGAIAIYQCFVLNSERAGGFHQIIMFGDISMAMGLMSLASIQKFARTRIAFLPYLAFFAGLTACILSGTRGGWLALVLAFIPLYSYGKKTIGRKILAVALVGAALLTSTYFIPQLNVAERLEAVASDMHQYQNGNPYSSVGARLEMWKGASKMFAEHPLFGVGRANYNHGLRDLIARGEISPTMQEFRHAHNEMLNALATEGIIGALVLLMLYAMPFMFFLRVLRRGDTATQPYALAGLLLVVSFADFGLTQVLFAHHVGAAFYAVVLSILAGVCIMQQRAEK